MLFLIFLGKEKISLNKNYHQCIDVEILDNIKKEKKKPKTKQVLDTINDLGIHSLINFQAAIFALCIIGVTITHKICDKLSISFGKRKPVKHALVTGKAVAISNVIGLPQVPFMWHL